MALGEILHMFVNSLFMSKKYSPYTRLDLLRKRKQKWKLCKREQTKKKLSSRIKLVTKKKALVGEAQMINSYFDNELMTMSFTSCSIDKIVQRLDLGCEDQKAWSRGGCNKGPLSHNYSALPYEYQIIPYGHDERMRMKKTWNANDSIQRTEVIGNLTLPTDVTTSMHPLNGFHDKNPEITVVDCEFVPRHPHDDLRQILHNYFRPINLQVLKFDSENETDIIVLKTFGSSHKLTESVCDGMSYYPITDEHNYYTVYFTSEGASGSSEESHNDSTESSAVSDQHQEGVIVSLRENRIQQQQQQQIQHQGQQTPHQQLSHHLRHQQLNQQQQVLDMVNHQQGRILNVSHPHQQVQQGPSQNPGQNRLQCHVSLAQERQARNHLRNAIDLQQAGALGRFIDLWYHRRQRETQIGPQPALPTRRNRDHQLYRVGIGGGDRQQEAEHRTLRNIPPNEMVNLHQVIAQESVEQRRGTSYLVMPRNEPQVQTGQDCYHICSFRHSTCFVRCSRCSARGDVWCQILQSPLCQLHHQELHPT